MDWVLILESFKLEMNIWWIIQVLFLQYGMEHLVGPIIALNMQEKVKKYNIY